MGLSFTLTLSLRSVVLLLSCLYFLYFTHHIISLIPENHMKVIFMNSMADVDECEDSNLSNCSHNANCTDTIGSYECFCSSGYTGDGFVCDGEWSEMYT